MRSPNRFQECGTPSPRDLMLNRFRNKAASISFKLIDFLKEIGR